MLRAQLEALLALVFAAAAAGDAVVDSNGHILIDARPVFLHGIYHDSMDATPMRYGADFRNDLRTIATAGFDTVWVSLDPTYDTASAESFAFLATAGLSVISNFYLGNAEAALASLSGSSALIGLSIGDDFNFPGSRPRYRPDDLAANRRLVAAAIPNALAIASGAAHPALPVAPYAHSMDVMALQCYPIGNTDQNVPGGVPYELEMCDDMLTSARRELGYDFPILPTLQAFEWGHAGARYPTVRELRNMFYTALQFAPAGVLWYSYYSGERPLAEAQPALWQELARLTADASRLEEHLLSGRFVRVDNPDDPYMEGARGAWHAAYWALAGEAYLIVTNTDTNAVKDVDFPLPGYSQMRPVMDRERYGSNLRYENERVRGAVDPYGVHVYSLIGAP
jgi:hypothetical protein